MSDPKPPISNDPTKLKPRLTIVQTINHQPPAKQPKSISSGFSRQLETHEQVYERELVATEEWQPLLDDRCWLDDCSLVIVTNEEGRYLSVNPTDKEREATAAKRLEIAFGSDQITLGQYCYPDNDPCWLVHPGETFHGTPSHPKALFIRSQSGEADFVLQVIPR